MKGYDSKKPSKFITYVDMNSLYGWAISGYLPHGGSKCLKNVDGFDVNSISEKSLIHHILEVDPEFPGKLYAFHNYYPLAPEKLAITYDMLSHYCKKIADEYQTKIGDVKNIISRFG